MRSSHLARLAALALSSALVLSACGGPGSSPSSAPSQGGTTGETTEQTSYKSELNIGIAANPPSLDPTASTPTLWADRYAHL